MTKWKSRLVYLPEYYWGAEREMMLRSNINQYSKSYAQFFNMYIYRGYISMISKQQNNAMG